MARRLAGTAAKSRTDTAATTTETGNASVSATEIGSVGRNDLSRGTEQRGGMPGIHARAAARSSLWTTANVHDKHRKMSKLTSCPATGAEFGVWHDLDMCRRRPST